MIMGESPLNNKYEYTYVFYGKKIVKNGSRYTIYVPNKLAEFLLSTCDGYVDIEIKAPTMYPKSPKKQK